MLYHPSRSVLEAVQTHYDLAAKATVDVQVRLKAGALARADANAWAVVEDAILDRLRLG